MSLDFIFKKDNVCLLYRDFDINSNNKHYIRLLILFFTNFN